MVSINYQTFGQKGFQLRLRLYQDGVTKYINVTKLLKGSIQKRHWNPKKQIFTPSCPFSDENNTIIVQFRQKYEQLAINWEGTLYGLMAQFEKPEHTPEKTLSGFIKSIVKDLKENRHPDGTLKGTFEGYQKLDKRLEEFFQYMNTEYEKLTFKEITPSVVNNILDWVIRTRDGKGLEYISKTLHSVIMKADKAELIDAKAFVRCNWKKGTNGSSAKLHTLSEDQINKLKEMDLYTISKSQYNELYRDFCLFMLRTGQSPCDVVSLKHSDIKKVNGFSHFIFKRRKIAEKQLVPCAVPIDPTLQAIINRWKYRSSDNYIFPIRNKKKLKTQQTNNGDIKHFISNLNNWLKRLGKALGCDFVLRAYTFRHTAITRYVSKGIPLAYISNMMGTSVKNIEKIYYNNLGDVTSRNKVLSAMAI